MKALSRAVFTVMSDGAHELLFISALAQFYGIPEPQREFRFDSARRWRFDFAWPDRRLAVEVEGGVWVRGRHTRGAGYLKDLEKYNRAVELGWRVLRYPPNALHLVDTYEQIARVYYGRDVLGDDK